MAAAIDLSAFMSVSGKKNTNGDTATPESITYPEPVSIDSKFTWADRLGAWAVRWGIRRMNYRVNPGLYALNSPGPDSPVLVTCNYKLTFDQLRRGLAGIAAWILVLDTKGVNVWCAAGKGTFGTKELLERIAGTGVARVAAHRTLILPQLGATGVSAPAVKTLGGWKVLWGPVRIADLPDFLSAGMKARPDMREVRFTFADRLVLTPIELVQGSKFLPVLVAVGAAMALPAGSGWLNRFVADGLVLALSLPVGAVLFPMLLPFLPGKAFGIKGLVLGFTSALLSCWGALSLSGGALSGAGILLGSGAGILIHTAIVVWLAMNFTGASTYTSQTGAMAEVRTALPWLFGALGLALVAIIAGIVITSGGAA